MRKKILTVLVYSTFIFSKCLDPVAQTPVQAAVQSADGQDVSVFLRDLSTPALSGDDELFAGEAKKIVAVLNRSAKKSPVLIDPTGNDREIIVHAAALRLSPKKKIFAIDWTALFSNSSNEAEAVSSLTSILALTEATKGGIILYLDDISAFSTDRPLLGKKIAVQLYEAIAGGKIQVLTGTSLENYLGHIAFDKRLKDRFARIDINDADPFVGDKLAPDLRALVAAGNTGETGKVFLDQRRHIDQ